MTADPRIQLAQDVFAGWSSGDADAPERYFHPDAVLSDIEGGEHRGWKNIRAFFAKGLGAWPDLKLIPYEYWVNERGVALSWVMSATVPDDRFGPETRGKRWESPGMSYLVIEDGKIVLEVDYHTRSQVTRSLGL